jgi:hypothetical protein
VVYLEGELHERNSLVVLAFSSCTDMVHAIYGVSGGAMAIGVVDRTPGISDKTPSVVEPYNWWHS